MVFFHLETLDAKGFYEINQMTGLYSAVSNMYVFFIPILTNVLPIISAKWYFFRKSSMPNILTISLFMQQIMSKPESC